MEWKQESIASAEGKGVVVISSTSTQREETWCVSCEDDTCCVEEGYLICSRCSVARPANLDSSAEWRFFSNDGGGSSSRQSDPCRVGMPLNALLPHAGTGSVITSRSRESYSMRRIRRIHHWSTLNFRGRSLVVVFEKLQSIARRNGIPAIIVDKSKILFKRVTECQLFRGENKEGLIATCIYRACKNYNVPRSVKEIADIFGIDEQKMTKGNRCFSRAFDEVNEIDLSRLAISRPADFVERFSCKLKISDTLYRQICALADKVDEAHIITDNTACSVAAAVLFFFCEYHGIEVTKLDIAKVSLISEVTITKCYKKLKKYESYLVDVLNSGVGVGGENRMICSTSEGI